MSYEETEVQEGAVETGLEDNQKADNSAKGGSRPTETVNQTGSSANTPTEHLPFDKDPKVQRYLEKMLNKERRQFEEKFKSYEERLNQRQQAPTGNSTQPGLTPEEQQAVDMLIEKISMSPKALEKLGLTKINSLEERFNQSNSAAMEQAMESDLSSVVSEYASKYGYEADDLQDQLLDYMANDPWLSGKQYHKGAMQKVAKLFFADKGKELAERETNLKLIKEKQTKQQNGTEAPSKGNSGKPSTNEKNLKDYLLRRVREEGGEVAL